MYEVCNPNSLRRDRQQNRRMDGQTGMITISPIFSLKSVGIIRINLNCGSLGMYEDTWEITSPIQDNLRELAIFRN